MEILYMIHSINLTFQHNSIHILYVVNVPLLIKHVGSQRGTMIQIS